MSTPAEDVEQPKPAGPGASLREAREARGWTRNDVATEMRLSTDLIAAMEEDAYDRLPAPIYVMGYLRNYARVLRIPPEPVIAAYQKAGVEQPQVAPEVGGPPRRTGAERAVRWISYLIIIVLIGLFAAWWQMREQQPLAPTNESPAAPEAAAAAPAATSPQVPAGTSAGSAAPAAAEARKTETKAETKTESRPQSDTQSEANPPPAVIPRQVARDSLAAVEVTAEPAPSPSPSEQDAAPTEAGPQADEVSPAPEVASGPQALLRLSFTEDCWTEVRDRRGRRLVYDLLRAGRTREVRGEAPFDVFLGNAAAVSIEYNANPFDHRDRVRGNLAHFKLGRAGDEYTSGADESP